MSPMLTEVVASVVNSGVSGGISKWNQRIQSRSTLTIKTDLISPSRNFNSLPSTAPTSAKRGDSSDSCCTTSTMSTPRKQRRTPSKSKILPPLYTPQEVKANGYSPRKATIQGSATSPQSARQQGGSGRKASTGSTAASTLSARKLRGSPRKGGTETSPQVAGQQLETSRRNSTTIPLFAAQPEKEQASGSRRPSAGRTAPSRRPAQFADQTPGSLKRAQESPIEESPPKRVASDNL